MLSFKLRSRNRRRIARILSAIILIESFGPLVVLAGGPNQPETQSFSPANADEYVDPFTGDFSYNIPLMDVGGYPVNLSYSSNPSMDQDASWVGLGWNVNVGSITRSMRGLPDDFKGDRIQKYTWSKPSKTFGITATPDLEFLGVENKKILNALGDPSLTVYYNTRKGFGYGLGISSGDFFSIGNTSLVPSLSFDTQAGIDLGLSLQYAIKGDRNEKIKGTSGYNSRSGYNGLNLSVPIQKVHDNFRMGHASMSFMGPTPTYAPQIKEKFSNTGLNLTLDHGGTLFGVEFQGDLRGFYQKQALSQNEYSQKGYGYLYTKSGENDKQGLHDINREKDGALSEYMNVLSIPNYTYDSYVVTAHGVGGSFRPYRNEIAVLGDPEQSQNNVNTSAGYDLGAGSDLKFGANVSVVVNQAESGGWYSSNIQGKLKMNEVSGSMPLFEPVYFKAFNEITNSGERIYNLTNGEKAVRIDRNSAGNVTSLLFDSDKNTLATPTVNPVNERDSRNTHFQYFTARQADRYGFNKQIVNNTWFKWNSGTNTVSEEGQHHSINREGGTRKSHHISEIQVTNESGQQFIYGTPVYNKFQTDFQFNFGSTIKANELTKTKSYSGSLSNNENVVSTNHNNAYFTKNTTPAHAHSYLLDAVLSPDYVDRTNDGITEDDYGTAFKFGYHRFSNDHKWRMPKRENHAYLERGMDWDPKDDMGSVSYGEKEVWYLSTIESKNYIARFVLDDRKDVNEITDSDGTSSSSSSALKKLVRIELYSKSGYGSKPPIKVVHFRYDYSLCQESYTGELNKGGSLSDDEVYVTTQNNRGKLTLKEVYFTYNGEDAGEEDRYLFNYGYNPDYDPADVDCWGSYLPNNTSTPNHAYPYPERYTNSSINTYAEAWNLVEITTPGSGRIEVEYARDQYKYVQDKKAMSFLKIEGAGDDADYSNTDHLYDPTNNANDLWSPNTYLYFTIPTEYSDSYSSLETLFEDVDELYYKFRINIDQTNKGTKWQYIRGYSKIKSFGLCNGGNRKAYVELQTATLKDNMGDQCHPIAKNAWSFLRTNGSDVLYDKENINGTGIIENLFGLMSFYESLRSMIQGPYRWMRSKKHAQEFDNSGPSQIRVNVNGFKYGGSSRVSQINIYDNWHAMGGGTQGVYTTYYKYGTGVASYEPTLGGEENPFRMPASYWSNVRMAPDHEVFQELPYGESFYPSPGVGYSSVTISSSPGSIISSPGPQKGGETVKSFYTAKDFPTRVNKTNLDKYIDKSPMKEIGAFASLPVVNNLYFDQGISVITNDMHGKPKGVWTYDFYTGEAVSGTRYIYKTLDQDQNGTMDGKILDNSVENVDGPSGHINSQTLGLDVDMVVDLRSNKSVVRNIGVNPNLTILGSLFPIPIPVLFSFLNTREDYLETSSITKVIHQHGLIHKVETYDQGAMVEANNLYYDTETGNVLITQTNNEFDDALYSVGFPAYWAYPDMAQSSLNSGMSIELKSQGGGNFVLSSVHPGDVHDYLIPGDILVEQNNKYWVVEATANGPVRIEDRVANGYIVPQNTELSFKVIRSGHRNMLGGQVASYAMTKHPVDFGAVPVSLKDFDDGDKIINASAMELTDNGKKIFRQAIAHDCVSLEYLSLNNYLNGLKIPRIPYRNWFYTSDRSSTNMHLSNSGSFTDFNSFWDYHSEALMPDYSGWNWQNQSLTHSPFGHIIEEINGLGVFSSTAFGYNQSLPIASAVNSRYHEMIFYSFDDHKYDDLIATCNPYLRTGRFTAGTSSISSTESHTGRYSLKINQGTSWEQHGLNHPCFPDIVDKYEVKLAILNNSSSSNFYVDVTNDLFSSTAPDLVAYVTNVIQGMVNAGNSDEDVYTEILDPNCEYLTGFTRSDQKIWVSGWIKAGIISEVDDVNVSITYSGGGTGQTTTHPISIKHKNSVIVDGWVQFNSTIPAANSNNPYMEIKVENNSNSYVYLDDLRIQPYKSQMKTYVYDPFDLRFVAELDENNFATFYKYDDEGNLSQVLKETSRGIHSIQETRSNLKATN